MTVILKLANRVYEFITFENVFVFTTTTTTNRLKCRVDGYYDA